MSTIETAPAVSQTSSLPRIEYAEPTTPAPVKAPRLLSLDVFRGITIAMMLLVNNEGNGHAYPALIHAGEQGPMWNGWTPTDLVFPFFLFIVGVATPFSLGKRAATGGTSRRTLLGHIWTRALSLFMLGELLAGIPWMHLAAPPAGYEWIKFVRIALWVFCCGGSLLLLFSPKKIAHWIPPILLVLFYGTAFGCHMMIKHTSGLPADFTWGSGLLNPTQLRIPGVLQRIGIVYGFAATIGLFFGWRMVAFWAIAFMTLYSALMLKVPFHDHHGNVIVGSLSKDDNFARFVDEWLLIREGHWNHAYSYPDNEGLISTLPAIASSLIGILVGVWLRTFRPVAERCAGVLVFGLFTLLLGLGLNRWFMPINKEIWTPSFTVFTAGMAMLCLGALFFIIDVLGRRRWAFPFVIYGMNAIAAFVAAGMIVRIQSLIQVHVRDQKEPVSLLHFLKDYAGNVIVDFDRWLAHTNIHLTVNTPYNICLSYSIFFVLEVLVLMTVLYLCRIFVKV